MDQEQIDSRIKEMFEKHYPDIMLTPEGFKSLCTRISELMVTLNSDLLESREDIIEELRKEIEQEIKDDYGIHNQKLESPACLMSFRELQLYLDTVKAFREMLDTGKTIAKDSSRYIELKQQEFELSEKLLRSRYW